MNIEISPKEYENKMNWDDGMLYCSLLVIDNKNDWRLPTLEELDYIRNSENDLMEDYYWSCIDYSEPTAWVQCIRHYKAFKRTQYSVRAVRDNI